MIYTVSSLWNKWNILRTVVNLGRYSGRLPGIAIVINNNA